MSVAMVVVARNAVAMKARRWVFIACSMFYAQTFCSAERDIFVDKHPSGRVFHGRFKSLAMIKA